MSKLIVTNLTKEYSSRQEKFRVLDNASAEWDEGLIHAIVGVNGAGKSTLLKIISGLTRPNSGQVSIPSTTPKGSNVSSRIGYLSPNAGLHAHLTILENIQYFCQTATSNHYDTTALIPIIEAMGLADAINKKGSDVSTGVIQRTRLANLLCINPKVLLLDEPTSGLDIDAKHAVYKTLTRLKTEKKLTLIATHDIGEIATICDTVSVVSNGMIKQNLSLPFDNKFESFVNRFYGELSKEIHQ